MHLTRLLLPGMLAHRQGHIINIGSIAGGLPNQGIAMYSATKAFLDAFSDLRLNRLYQSDPKLVQDLAALMIHGMRGPANRSPISR